MLTSYMHVHLSLILHTHWEFWLPEFTSRYMGITFTEQVSEEIVCIWGIRSLLAWSLDSLVQFMSFFYPVDFYQLSITRALYLFYWFICRMILSCVKHYMYYCSDLIAFIVDLYNLFRYFKLNVYTWNIFLVYIRHQLSSRFRSSVFWETGCDRFFWYYSQVYSKMT